MIRKSDAELILSRALATGADFAEIFAENVKAGEISLLSKKVENAAFSRSVGAGVRVFQGTKTVYAYTNDLTLDGMLKCASQAAAALGTAKNDVPVVLCSRIVPNIHGVQYEVGDVQGKRKADLLHLADAAARSVSDEIKQVSAGLSDSRQDVLIANTEGLYVTDTRVHTRLRISAIARNEGGNQTGSQSPGAQAGYEFIESLNVEGLAKQAATSAVTMLHADFCPAGNMPVVIENGFGGVIFHEACGHALEATAVGKGSSVFCGKMGQQIASVKVNAVDDGTIPNAWGSENIDDEGNPQMRRQLIKDGILTSYMIDRLGSRRMNLPMTGSGRRQSYCFAPTSRMSNTFIEAGTDDDEEMIATMGDGLYAKQMGGGSVNPVTGEFNFAVNEGYLVRDGKITEPVRGATLIGKGADILFNIDRVGKNVQRAQGMCGSVSGSIPTDVGQPRIRVSAITVGGRKEDK